MHNVKMINRLRTRNVVAREFMAEMAGTFILVLFVNAAGAQNFLSEKITGTAAGSFLSGNWGGALAVLLGVLVAGGVTGAHMNPAVTLALVVVGKCHWKKMFHFMLAQYLGGFLAAALVYLTYMDAFETYRGLTNADGTANGWDIASAGVFATFPSGHLSIGGGFLDQVVGTGLLLFMVLAIIDPRNMVVKSNLIPLYIGFTILAIAICFSYNCGAAINPARDLAPRAFAAMVGWGGKVFSYGDYFFWIPIVATHVGAIIGALLYTFLVENHWPRKEDEERREETQRNNHS